LFNKHKTTHISRNFEGEELKGKQIMIKNAAIESTPQVLGGTPVFQGTRVPVRTLIEYLEAGDRLDDFLKDFPTASLHRCSQAISSRKSVATTMLTGGVTA